MSYLMAYLYIWCIRDTINSREECLRGQALRTSCNGSTTEDVVSTSTPGSDTYGTTDIYAAKLGLDAFHGISVDGSKMLKTYLPDLQAPGAVKTGEVELIAGAVLKNSKMAGVLKGIKLLGKTA